MRHTKRALRTHRGHIDTVTSVDWSPTGKEFVSGGMDGHIRIWKSDHQTRDANAKKVGYSRELYKGRRMYNLHQVRWTNDDKYILSGSADGGIRLWKSQRSMPLHRINARQRLHLQYCEKLKMKYQHMPQIGLIWKFRNAKVAHRKPRNGVFYKKERMEQKKLIALQKKIKEVNSRNKKNETKIWRVNIRGFHGKKDIKRKLDKKGGGWASRVVESTGMVHEYAA